MPIGAFHSPHIGNNRLTKYIGANDLTPRMVEIQINHTLGRICYNIYKTVPMENVQYVYIAFLLFLTAISFKLREIV